MSSASSASRRVLDRAAAARRSAIWAAWGDALGFPTELVRDLGDVARRVGTERAETTKAWRRRVGGRMGVEVELPAGMYSDDTQLRLAVARCIRGAERFDVEVFSKVELPIFLSYGFGIGRGTRAAAQSLTKRSVRWYSNFYDARSAVYLRGGGNGAAMRIQPHVWATPRLDDRVQFLQSVVRDAVTTHGHIRGSLGAAMHAVALAIALDEGAPPEPSRWFEIAESLYQLIDVVQNDEALRERWLPAWEQRSRSALSEALASGIEEVEGFLRVAQGMAPTGTTLESTYVDLAEAIGGRAAATRGSGTVSAVLSLWLAHHGAAEPATALRVAANVIGSDTDTVASMTGALIGVCAPDQLPGPLVDEPLISAEAGRLTAIAFGEQVPSFPHPDPLHWQPPKTQADALGVLDGQTVVAGLGPAVERSEPIAAPDGGLWQWVELEVGQTLLMKRREELPRLAGYAAPQPRLVLTDGAAPSPRQRVEQEQLPAETDEANNAPEETTTAAPVRPVSAGPVRRSEYPDDVHEGVALVVRMRFDMILIGKLLVHYALQEDGAVRAAVFAAEVARELREHDRRSSARRHG